MWRASRKEEEMTFGPGQTDRDTFRKAGQSWQRRSSGGSYALGIRLAAHLAIRSLAYSLVVLVMTAIPALANAQQVLHDGRYYQVVLVDGISWEAARTAAQGMSFQNVQGHLATIN